MRSEEVRAYQQRWKLVAEREREELQRQTYAQKFSDLVMLVDVARSLSPAPDEHREIEVEQVRRRWVLLAERCRG